MRNKKIWLVLLVLSLLAAIPVWAQGIPSGTLTGNVSDEAGAGLPGASVTATSPALQGSRTAVTNINGDWVFPNVPPGEYNRHDRPVRLPDRDENHEGLFQPDG